MGGLFGGSQVKAAAVAPAPQVDDATAKINAQDAEAKKRGQKATILTSDTGLPNLGVTTTTGR
jgi:hypothetical protein